MHSSFQSNCLNDTLEGYENERPSLHGRCGVECGTHVEGDLGLPAEGLEGLGGVAEQQFHLRRPGTQQSKHDDQCLGMKLIGSLLSSLS